MNFEKDDCKVCEIDHEEVNNEWISLACSRLVLLKLICFCSDNNYY